VRVLVTESCCSPSVSKSGNRFVFLIVSDARLGEAFAEDVLDGTRDAVGPASVALGKRPGMRDCGMACAKTNCVYCVAGFLLRRLVPTHRVNQINRELKVRSNPPRAQAAVEISSCVQCDTANKNGLQSPEPSKGGEREGGGRGGRGVSCEMKGWCSSQLCVSRPTYECQEVVVVVVVARSQQGSWPI
jgi:hypothetical protein